jgi:periplasmic divalent cation tolerance protein
LSGGAHGLLMTTTPSREDAQRLARLLVEEKLAACVQMMPIESTFFWKEKVQEEKETLLLVKTRTALFETAIARIKALHRYEVPEIVAMPFTAGSASYFQWMDEVTCAPRN